MCGFCAFFVWVLFFFFLVKCGDVKILDASVYCVLTFQASTRFQSLTTFYISHLFLLCLAEMF